MVWIIFFALGGGSVFYPGHFTSSTIREITEHGGGVGGEDVSCLLALEGVKNVWCEKFGC